MALLFEEDKRRLTCSCGGRRIQKVSVFTYLQNPKDNTALDEQLIETELRCCKCNKVVKVIRPGKEKILS